MTSSTPSELTPDAAVSDAAISGAISSPWDSAAAETFDAVPELNGQDMTEDQLLDGVMQASNLQQAGQDAAAIALYQTLVAADPQGQYGAMARKALEGMSEGVSQGGLTRFLEKRYLEIRE